MAMQKHQQATRSFGELESEIRPVCGLETANNASLGGALHPHDGLGIPGDSITAMLIAGLTIHDQAGPVHDRTA